MPKFKFAFLAAIVAFLAFGSTAVFASTTVHVNNSLTNVQSACTDQGGTITQWHFVLNQYTGATPTLTVVWSNGDTTSGIVAGKVVPGTAHYYIDATADHTSITDAYVTVSGTRGMLVLSDVTCIHPRANVTLTKNIEDGPFTHPGEVCFTLSPAAGSSSAEQCYTFSESDTSHVFEWDNLPPGSYTISETTVPDGYDAVADIDFTVALDCTGIDSCILATDPPTTYDAGSFDNNLSPGFLEVLKQLGTDSGPAAWPAEAGDVTFYVCANDPANDPTPVSPCDSSNAVATIVVNAANNPGVSGPLDESYYTVCEDVPSGYTVDTQCQVTQVLAGQAATANELTFVNTPVVHTWCSPGFWKTHESLWTAYWDVLYNDIPNGGDIASNPTIKEVVEHPEIYGGPATNYVADYLSIQFGLNPVPGAFVDNCPLS